jgi:hypothetical protein
MKNSNRDDIKWFICGIHSVLVTKVYKRIFFKVALMHVRGMTIVFVGTSMLPMAREVPLTVASMPWPVDSSTLKGLSVLLVLVVLTD